MPQDPSPLPCGVADLSPTDDSLSMSELVGFYNSYFPDASDAEKSAFSDASLDRYDSDESGAISCSEAAAGLLSDLAKLAHTPTIYNEVLFKMDDTNGDGYLDASETDASFFFDSSGCEAPLTVFDANEDDQLNLAEATSMAEAVLELSSSWARPLGCHTVPNLAVSGTFCEGTARVARVCAPTGDDGSAERLRGEVYAKMKAHCMIKRFEEDNSLTTCVETASDFCSHVGGSVAQGAGCTLMCQQAMSECLIDSDCRGGEDTSSMSLTVYGSDLISDDVYPEVPFTVYSGYPSPFYGCKDSSWFGCGTEVVSGQLSGSASGASVAFEVGTGNAAWFLVVIGGEQGYGYSYHEIRMVQGGGNVIRTSLLKLLQTDQDRIILSWPHSGDLDLWIFAIDSDESIIGSVGWNYNKKTGTFDSTVVTLEKDSLDGQSGSETTLFEGMRGTYQVWVNNYDGAFVQSEVLAAPATLQVYCSECHDSYGYTVRGRITVTQDSSVVPSGMSWWKVGSFVAPSTVGGGSMRAQWISCSAGAACYATAPAGFVGPVMSSGTLFVSARDALSGARVAANYAVFTAYPSSYVGCYESGTCGVTAQLYGTETDAAGTLSTSESTQIQLESVYGMSSYLVVVYLAGSYTNYVQVHLEGGQFIQLNTQMVETLNSGQDRVVLTWGSVFDLDLWIVAKDASGGLLGSVGWNVPEDYSKTDTLGGATITLDVDNWDSADGPETSQINGMTTGSYEVWVHSYNTAEVFDYSSVAADAAKVDVYCAECHDDNGQTIQGLVKSLKQSPATVYSGGARWWKVGTFVAPSDDGTVRAQWHSCPGGLDGDTCYQSIDPTIAGRRRRTIGPEKARARKPGAEHRNENRPAAIKFSRDAEWIAYKQMHAKMRRVMQGSSRSQVESTGFVRSKARSKVTRHSGRLSSGSGIQHMRAHAGGITEYGYSLGDFATPYHVSAIGDLHLICCDRFRRAVKETCQGVSDTALNAWIDSGKAAGWCHETSCFDGQALRAWSGSLSWMDYTDYRWGNMSFTTRSECHEPRDWPDLMNHFKTMEACNGGLGKLLIPQRFHVWACFHNHPCATRALTDPYGLWALFRQGYTDFSVEQINILILYVSDRVQQTGVALDDPDLDVNAITWNGGLTWAQIETFFLFVVRMVITLGDVFYTDVSSLFGDLWWIGLETSGTCESIDRNDGFTCRDTPCCYYHPMLGCQSQLESHPCNGQVDWTFQLSSVGWAWGGAYSPVQTSYFIYRLSDDIRFSYWGCFESNACGAQLTSGTLIGGSGSVSVDSSAGSRFLVVFTASEYMTMYHTVNMLYAEQTISAQVMATLLDGQDRLALRWSSDADLDMWIFIRDPASGGAVGALRGSVGWQYGKSVYSSDGVSINYVHDSLSGFSGPEIIDMQGAAGGVFEVWVNMFSEGSDATYSKEDVQMYPASVDVYCFQCHNNSMTAPVYGGVGSIQQNYADIIDNTRSWWKVGEFIAPSSLSSSVRLQWVTCLQNCYYADGPAPRVGSGTAEMTAKNSVDGSALSGSFVFYSGYPAYYTGCLDTQSCGTRVANGTIDAGAGTTSVTVPVNLGVSRYLVVAKSANYYDAYAEISVTDGGIHPVLFNLVAVLPENHERIVLRWSTLKDLDLWVVFKDSADGFVGAVGWNTPGEQYNFPNHGFASLDRDNYGNSFATMGPETTSLQQILPGTIVEVWVNRFGVDSNNVQNVFTPEDSGQVDQEGVRGDPAVVDVYCNSCHNDQEEVLSGSVTSVTQIASQIPEGGRSWWRAGRYVAPSPVGTSRLQWQTCVGRGCWTNNDPTQPSSYFRRRLPGQQKKKMRKDAPSRIEDPYETKVHAERAKKVKAARQSRVAGIESRKQARVDESFSSRGRSRYYFAKNLDADGIQSTYSSSADTARKPHGRKQDKFSEADRDTVGALFRNAKFFKHAVAQKYGLERMGKAISKASLEAPKEKEDVRIRSSHDSPAGPREAMCYVYDEVRCFDEGDAQAVALCVLLLLGACFTRFFV